MKKWLTLCLILGLLGCSGTSSSPSPVILKQSKLPPEVEGSPEDAMKAQKKVPGKPR